MPRRNEFPLLFLLACVSLSALPARAATDAKCEHPNPDHLLLTGEPGLN